MAAVNRRLRLLPLTMLYVGCQSVGEGGARCVRLLQAPLNVRNMFSLPRESYNVAAHRPACHVTCLLANCRYDYCVHYYMYPILL